MYNNSANTLFVGKPLIYLPSCHSTNAIASEKLSEGSVAEGTAIIAFEQTAGKGQRGNSWEAEPGKNLTFSVILKPHFLSINRQFLLNELTSLAVSDALTKYLGNKIKVKWPNDVFFENKKICGILIQNFLKGSRIENTVIGIGVNVNQTQFSEQKATSMIQHLERETNLSQILSQIFEGLEKYYLLLKEKNTCDQEMENLYKEKLFRINEKALYKADDIEFWGVLKGVDHLGRLHVQTEKGDMFYNFKEIEFCGL